MIFIELLSLLVYQKNWSVGDGQFFDQFAKLKVLAMRTYDSTKVSKYLLADTVSVD